jgi:hypothetical protein
MIIREDRAEDTFFIFPKSQSKIRITTTSEEPVVSGREEGRQIVTLEGRKELIQQAKR